MLVTARPKVYHLDRTLTSQLQQDVFLKNEDGINFRLSEKRMEERREREGVREGTDRFQITVDDFLSMQQLETLKQGVGKAPNQRYTETLKVVLFYQFVEIHAAGGDDGCVWGGGQGLMFDSGEERITSSPLAHSQVFSEQI